MQTKYFTPYQEIGAPEKTQEQTRIKNPIRLIVELIVFLINSSQIDKERKTSYCQKLEFFCGEDMLEQISLAYIRKITGQDLKYIICFYINMDVKDISMVFNVTPASVRTARYRIRKKIGKTDLLKFLI